MDTPSDHFRSRACSISSYITHTPSTGFLTPTISFRSRSRAGSISSDLWIHEKEAKEAEQIRKMLEDLEKEWAEDAAWSKEKKAKSWYGKKPKDMSNNELKDYVEALLYEFDKNKQSDENLMEYFWEPDGFREFSIDDFRRLGSPLQLKLRKYLRYSRVYIPSSNLSQALYSFT